MPWIDFVMATDAPPDAVREAFLDFSDRRPDRWPGLPRDQYEVYEVGDTWAEIREGYRGPIWFREHYDWSTPGRITWTAVDGGFATAGSYVILDIEPADGGGSILRVVWVRHPRNTFGRLFLGLMSLTRGALLRRSFRMGLDLLPAQTDLIRPS